jgi:hypothetical protein
VRVRAEAWAQVKSGSVGGMSEPMPGDMPAQQYGHAAGPGRLPEHADGERPLPAGESEAPDGQAGQAGLSGQAGSSEWAGPVEQTDPEMYGEQPGDDQPEAADDAADDAVGDTEHEAVDARDDALDEDDADDDDGPRPLGLHVEPTGHAPVDVQLRRLEDADHLAVSGHLEVYEDVHRGLRDTLTALDRPAPGPPYPRG